MTAPDRSVLKPVVATSKVVTKSVRIELGSDAIEAAISEWLTRHYAEFRNLEVKFDWYCYESIPRVDVTGSRTTESR